MLQSLRFYFIEELIILTNFLGNMEYKDFKRLLPTENPQVTVDDILEAIEKHKEQNDGNKKR